MKRALRFHIVLDDVSITHVTFSPEFTHAVEAKQVLYLLPHIMPTKQLLTPESLPYSSRLVYRGPIRSGRPTNGSPSGFPRGSSYPRETGKSALPNLISPNWIHPSIRPSVHAEAFPLLFSVYYCQGTGRG